jgi:hypothetical protein
MSTVTSKDALLTLATVKQKEIIRHEFTRDETIEMKDQISTNLIKINDLKDELDEIKEQFKASINPMEKENKRLLMDIRLGFRDQELNVYLVPDYDNKIMELYDDEGTKVGERKMMMSEYQQQRLH